MVVLILPERQMTFNEHSFQQVQGLLLKKL